MAVEKKIYRDKDGRGYLIVTDDLDFEALRKLIILRALKDANYVQRDAAKILNITGRALNYHVTKYQITHPKWRRNCGLNGGYRKKRELEAAKKKRR